MFTTNLFEYVKQRISPLDVYSKYIDNVVFDKKMKSPLRNNDDDPSFIIYSNTGVFIDFAYRKGDWLNFVCYKYNLNYHDAILKIAKDFNLINYDNNNVVSKNLVNTITKKEAKIKKDFKIIYRQWNNNDKDFWTQFNIFYKTLNFFNVKPIIGFWILNKNQWNFFKTDIVSYVYHIGSRIKIYQPYRDKKDYKFLGNVSKNSVQGYTQIDFNKLELIITSSLKDVMLLYEFNYQSIAPSSESTIISKFIIDFLLDNFQEDVKIKLLYDWDEAGITLAKEHSLIYNADILIPKNYKNLLKLNIKDPSDYQKHYKNIKKTNNFLNKIINGNISPII